MFKSKQFFTALAIAIFIGALAGGVYITQRNDLPDIFGYVPTGMDQVMVNRAEKNIQNNTNMLIEVPQAVQEQFQQIKVMIIVQDESFSGEQMVFLQTKSDFSPEDFLQTINPENETTSTYLRLDDGQYVFGPQQTIQSYTKPIPDKTLFQQSQLKKYIPIIRRSSLSIVSNNNDLFSTQKEYSSLLDSAEYLVMNISSSPRGEFDFSAYVILSQSQAEQQNKFKPQFTSLLKESTITYLELGKILSGIDISAQLASGSAQDLLLKKLLANNLAIVVSKGANMFNLGVTIVADNPSLFTDLEPFFPLLGMWLQSQPMISGNQVTSIQQPGKIGYDITLQGVQKIGAYLEQTENQTKISLGNPLIEGAKRKLKGYSKNALAVLYVDMNQLLNLYKQFANIGLNTSVLTTSQESMFTQMQDKTLRGEIAIEKDAISIKGSIK
ncbi:hypothetical protein P148_SR1C00001G1088 [candidate division SR1 bacterium RAAC1_SR1_1]|nr:hypothetical protein P148_SR1C00001G1088 [candidate division SR1 bacterium RAAC1_SR1_1]